MNTYCVSVFFRGRHDTDEVPEIWEESFVIMYAASEADAITYAEEWARDKRVRYAVSEGGRVTWDFERADRAVLVDGPIRHGTEIFSRFLREEEARSLMKPFD